MKVVQITTSSSGGAGMAALRLHRALRLHGVSSAYISKNLTIDFDGNTVCDPFFKYHKPSFFKKIINKLQLTFFPAKRQKINTQLTKKESFLNYEIKTVPFSRYKLQKHPLVKQADIVNLHWVGMVLNYESFFAECKKPIVWTLHDMNPFLGLFHYREDMVRNIKEIGTLDDHLLQLKALAISKIKHGALIAPSQWMLGEAEESQFFKHFSIRKTIPNSVDLDIFCTQDKVLLRKQKDIPEDDFVMLFISHNVGSLRKGFDLLSEALNGIGHIPAIVLIVGNGHFETQNKAIKAISLGEIKTPEQMAMCYGMADVFVMPSREDNLPNVMLESLACGTPVISFAVGGMVEHISENTTGILAKETNGKSLAETIQKFYKSKSNYDKMKIRTYAEKNFNFKKQADSYKEIYENILNL